VQEKLTKLWIDHTLRQMKLRPPSSDIRAAQAVQMPTRNGESLTTIS
jgi:hypothetical protein